MCGLAGFLGGGYSESEDADLLSRMSEKLTHRGPDSSGIWYDNSRRIGLCHRRLSIVDLSPAGHQPMISPSGRYVTAFNGEIYNHLDLRKELEFPWRGHSDTETLLAGFEVWGIQGTIERSVGMFAIAVWDRQELTLTLIRDRMGEKPLYYGWQGNSFLFSSELKGLRVHPDFCAGIDRGALSLYLRHNYIPAPHSIYRDISKLQPGCLLTVSLRQREPQILKYWSLASVAASGVAHSFEGGAREAINELETLLRDSVRRQMVADVPLGAFLSGGVDSSTVVALMQSLSHRPVKTFTIGFKEEGYNEAHHAKAVAQHLGTEHTELYVTAEQAMAVIPRLPELYDEPFADSSQIPTYLVSRLARAHVAVSLSGDAGDELFCGYGRYQFASSLWNRIGKVPLPLRVLGAKGISAVPVSVWNKLANPLNVFRNRVRNSINIGDKLHKGSDLLLSKSQEDLYYRLLSLQRNPSDLVIDGHEPRTILTGLQPALPGLGSIERMMALDSMTYLPDDILVKVDRAAMSVSLEGRMPLLDHRVVEFAWHLPQSMKICDGQTKWALRQVLYRHVPKELIERPKKGFSVPLDDWLRGPLRDWAECLLAEDRLRHEGYFEPVPIRKMWQEHSSARRNWANHLWGILMFQAWKERELG